MRSSSARCSHSPEDETGCGPRRLRCGLPSSTSSRYGARHADGGGRVPASVSLRAARRDGGVVPGRTGRGRAQQLRGAAGPGAGPATGARHRVRGRAVAGTPRGGRSPAWWRPRRDRPLAGGTHARGAAARARRSRGGTGAATPVRGRDLRRVRVAHGADAEGRRRAGGSGGGAGAGAGRGVRLRRGRRTGGWGSVRAVSRSGAAGAPGGAAGPADAGVGDPRTRTRDGLDAVLGPAGFAPVDWETLRIDLGGNPEQVWSTVSAVYDLDVVDAPAVARLRRSFLTEVARLAPRGGPTPCGTTVHVATARRD